MKEFITDLLTKINNSLDARMEEKYINLMKNAVATQSGIVFNGTIASGFNNTSMSLAVGDPTQPANFSNNLPSFITSYNTSTKKMYFKKGFYLINGELQMSGTYQNNSYEMGYAAVALECENGAYFNFLSGYGNNYNTGAATKSSVMYIHSDGIKGVTCKLIAAINTTSSTLTYNVAYEIVPLFYL